MKCSLGIFYWDDHAANIRNNVFKDLDKAIWISADPSGKLVSITGNDFWDNIIDIQSEHVPGV